MSLFALPVPDDALPAAAGAVGAGVLLERLGGFGAEIGHDGEGICAREHSCSRWPGVRQFGVIGDSR